LGPGGAGKSSFVRALVGRLRIGWIRSGAWEYRGRPGSSSWPADGALLFREQPSRRSGALGVEALDGHQLAASLLEFPEVAILDEPRFDLEQAESRAWLSALAAARERGTTSLLVTHDVSLAESIADEVLLFYGGSIVASGAAPGFFLDPPNDVARQFVKLGNCCLPAPRPDLPSHFRWIIAGKLAGMGRPGLISDADADLAAIAAAGITDIVCLTEEPPALPRLRSFGLDARHFPIPDMGVPATGSAARVCRDVSRLLQSGSAVAVHCHAGLGRTGLLLAAVLVWEGASAEEAIVRVREQRSGYLQNRAQELFVERFASEHRGSGLAVPQR
jgi:atypical dual specificity phosphatase